jgi:RND family efflux transporter MFP subunit
MIDLFKKPLSFFKRLSFKKKIVVVIVLGVILIFGWNKIFGGRADQYVTGEVTRATITQSVSEIGNVEAGASVDITSPSTGVVEEVLVDNGDEVDVGDLLFKVVSSATEQEKSAAYSNYLTAVSSLNTAGSTANSLKSTMLSKWKIFYDLATNSTYENDDNTPKTENRVLVEFNTAKEDWLAAEAKYKDQQTAIFQAHADVSSKLLLYEATQNAEVKATSKGRVANLAVAQGSDTVASDTVLVIVTESKNPYVRLPINEIDVTKIEEGQKAEIEVDAIDDKIFKGIVDRVDSVGTNTQGVITYNVYVKLIDTSPLIRSEMTANVDIQTKTVDDALSVPNGAVKPYQGGRAVQMLEGNEAKYIPVRIGIRGDERTEIIEGLSEGQEIIIGATNELIRRSGGFGF